MDCVPTRWACLHIVDCVPKRWMCPHKMDCVSTSGLCLHKVDSTRLTVPTRGGLCLHRVDLVSRRLRLRTATTVHGASVPTQAKYSPKIQPQGQCIKAQHPRGLQCRAQCSRGAVQSAVHKRGTHNAVHTMDSAEHSAQVGQSSQLLSKEAS